jgi:hypothetical protein
MQLPFQEAVKCVDYSSKSEVYSGSLSIIRANSAAIEFRGFCLSVWLLQAMKLKYTKLSTNQKGKRSHAQA